MHRDRERLGGSVAPPEIATGAISSAVGAFAVSITRRDMSAPARPRAQAVYWVIRVTAICSSPPILGVARLVGQNVAIEIPYSTAQVLSGRFLLRPEGSSAMPHKRITGSLPKTWARTPGVYRCSTADVAHRR